MANSTPLMVDLDSRLNSLRVKRESRLDLPMPVLNDCLALDPPDVVEEQWDRPVGVPPAK